MYELKVTVAKAAVMEEVNRTCGYMGARMVNGDGSLYNNIAADKEDAEMMEGFWKEACAGLVEAGKDFVKTSGDVDGGGVFGVSYEMPGNYNKAVAGSVTQAALSYVTWYVAGKWLELCGLGEAAQGFGQTAGIMLKRLGGLLYARTHSRATEDGEGKGLYGDEVESGGGGGSDEPEGKGMYGDEVESGTGGGSDEPEGEGMYGDEVESGTGGGDDEPEGEGVYGGTMPQNFGAVRVERYDYE